MTAHSEPEAYPTAGAAKTRRVLAALNHEPPDRVPVGEFFWTNFVRRCRAEMDVGDDFDPYRHWDLDMIVLVPNMDPHVTGIEVLADAGGRTVVKTGFGATVERRRDYPMPAFLDFEHKTYEQIEALEFDDPADPRRYFEPIDDQINSVADALNLHLPPFVERVGAYADDFCVWGSVCEAHETIWRIMGSDNVLLKMAERPDRIARFVERLGEFLVGIVHGQVAAAEGKLRGMYIWGDVAYDGGMFFSPDYWRDVFQPVVRKLCDAAHEHGLKTIYHGCGDARAVYDGLIDAGVDGYNPLEAKAGLDVVELKRTYGKRWAFNGNLDVRVLATNDRDRVRREVLRKLNAAKGGGFILQSDHSVPDNVDPGTYDYVIRLAREHGTYPLDLGEHDEPV
jgi:uroporphyrinogen decarboxylase